MWTNKLGFFEHVALLFRVFDVTAIMSLLFQFDRIYFFIEKAKMNLLATKCYLTYLWTFQNSENANLQNKIN